MLVNSEKGSRILNKVIDNIHCVECDLNASIKSNPNLSRPTAKPDSREDFWDFYYKNGFEKTFKKYYNKIRIKKIKRRIKLKFYSLKTKRPSLIDYCPSGGFMKLLFALRSIFLLPHFLVFKLCEKHDVLCKDLESWRRLCPKKNNCSYTYLFFYMMCHFKEFRNVFYLRLGNIKYF